MPTDQNPSPARGRGAGEREALAKPPRHPQQIPAWRVDILRERLLGGESIKAIAVALGLSPNSTFTYARQIYAREGCQTREQFMAARIRALEARPC